MEQHRQATLTEETWRAKVHMNVMNNSALVWKRKADESDQSAKTVTRISLVLLVLMSLSGGYAYSTHHKLSGLCNSLERGATAAETATGSHSGLDKLRAYCR